MNEKMDSIRSNQKEQQDQDNQAAPISNFETVKLKNNQVDVDDCYQQQIGSILSAESNLNLLHPTTGSMMSKLPYPNNPVV